MFSVICSIQLNTLQEAWAQEKSPSQLTQTADTVANKILSSGQPALSDAVVDQESSIIFPKKKRARHPIDPFKKEQEAELLRISAQLGLGIVLTSGIYAILGEPLNLSLLLGPIMGNLFTGPLRDFGNKLSLFIIPKLAKSSLQKGVQLKSAYQKQNTFFSKYAGVYGCDSTTLFL